MDERERMYCATMMIEELSKLRNQPGDTRAYLSLDENDKVVVGAALRSYLAAVIKE